MEDEDEAHEQSVSDEEEEMPMQFRGGPDKFHVSEKAVDKYGPIDGCPACTSITKRGMVSGRVGVIHSDQCRKIIMTATKNDPQYRKLMKRHEAGVNVDAIDKQGTRLQEQRGNLKKSMHRMKQKMKETTNTTTKQLEQTMLQTLIAQMDVAESYSPPRITSMAPKMGIRAGCSMDITTNDTDGRPWGSNTPEMRNRAARKVLNDKPWLPIESPMCIVHSVMNNINHCKMQPAVVRARFKYARDHRKFATELYMFQTQGGRYLLHEHPENASPWEEQCIKDVSGTKGINRVVGVQCCYGLKAKGEPGMGPARKTIGVMTNSPRIALQLKRRRPRRDGYYVHKHVHLDGGRAKAAQIYSPGLCRAVCKRLIKQFEADRNGQYLFMNMEYKEDCSSKEVMKVAEQLKEKYRTVGEEYECENEVAWDDVFGATLDPSEVRRAREEEIKYVRNMELYEKVAIEQCYAKIGKAPISRRWIDINKEDQTNPTIGLD